MAATPELRREQKTAERRAQLYPPYDGSSDFVGRGKVIGNQGAATVNALGNAGAAAEADQDQRRAPRFPICFTLNFQSRRKSTCQNLLMQ